MYYHFSPVDGAMVSTTLFPQIWWADCFEWSLLRKRMGSEKIENREIIIRIEQIVKNHSIRKKKNMEGKNDPEQESRHSVNKDPDDIELFFHSGQGFSEGKRVHFGMRGFYHTADHTVYIETWGPGGNKVESCRIPDKAGKTRGELLQYLKEKNVFVPL